ncbi:MAG: HAD family phosphatase [Chloroflexi bacterium]|nr:HAD family phosphatase [Chloroflexota bacterium]
MTNFCPQAVLFDMDGTLIDSEPVWQIAEDALITARGQAPREEVRKAIIGMRLTDSLSVFRDSYGFTETVAELRAELIERMCSLIPTHVKPKPGATALIAYFSANGVPCAIASSSPLEIIETAVASQNWRPYMRHLVSGDQVAHGKPAPDIYLEAAQRMGFAPEVCLSIEDSVNGSRSAVAAGTVCYIVPDLSHSTLDQFDGISPHMFSDLHAVQRSLEHCDFG